MNIYFGLIQKLKDTNLKIILLSLTYKESGLLLFFIYIRRFITL